MPVHNAKSRLLSLVIGLWIAGILTPVEVLAQIKHYGGSSRVIAPSEVLARLREGDIPSRDIRSAFEIDERIDDSTMYRGNYG